ncbi:ABC transporter substrate-binding protein [Streptomyces sp. CAU 1734]|uniref:ABC transporter substrate-binding protein n=1 Tax=Streptomyces sp. CAU 1734 TaxID=3140360 RepID=UPI003261776B
MRWTWVAGRAVLAVAVALTALAAPAARPGGTSAGTDRRGPLTLVTGRDLTGYLRGVLDGWNRTHPGERVRLIQLPDTADEVHAQMRESLRSGSGRFDVLNIDVTWTAEFAGEGWISAVDPRGLPLGDLLPAVIETAVYDGRLYAVPFVTNAGLLFYRKDILDRERMAPPRTWDELATAASRLSRKYGMGGYGGQFLPYEGLTVNVTEAILSAGGSLVDERGEVTADSPRALAGLSFLTRGVREGWIPRESLGHKEENSRLAFQSGKLIFLRNWPYVHAMASENGSQVAGRFAAVPLPGPAGPGVGVLGGSNLAVNSRSRHPDSAADLMAYLLSESVQRRVLTEGGLPPVRESLYLDRGLAGRFPWLPALLQSVRKAGLRPKHAEYEQMTLAVAAISHGALAGRVSPAAALKRLDRELREVLDR